MADNFATDSSGNVISKSFASREVTYSGDATRHIAPVGLVAFTGSDDAKTPIDLPGDATNGLDVDVTRVPTDPFGANADAVVAAGAAGSIQAKLRRVTTDLGTLAAAITSARMQVDIISGGLTITRPATATRASVTITTNNTVAALNTGRLGLIVTNPIANTTRALLKYGATATTTDYDIVIDPGTTWQEPTGYTGRIDGILESGSGAVRVLELTA